MCYCLFENGFAQCVHNFEMAPESLQRTNKAKAVFAENMELLHIFVSNLDKIVLPGDEQWEHAKFAWKVSLMDLITIGPHLGHCHWIISNVAHIAARYDSKILNREVGSKKLCHK